ncbi:hypothetical protein U0070_020782 [Myodes glareolus]|uniref:Uncharacterized protein n=1 Tax=Myodes glareolus TaxID=447135 RepID=A0AAW0IDU6_MYOGA
MDQYPDIETRFKTKEGSPPDRRHHGHESQAGFSTRSLPSWTQVAGRALRQITAIMDTSRVEPIKLARSRAGVLSVSFLEMRSMLILEECKIHRHQEKEKQNDDVVSGNGGPEADFLGPSTLILVRELQ